MPRPKKAAAAEKPVASTSDYEEPPRELHSVPAPADMPTTYMETVREFVTGRESPKSEPAKRLIEKLKVLIAQAQQLEKGIAEGQQQLAKAQAQHTGLLGQVEGLATMVWEFEK